MIAQEVGSIRLESVLCTPKERILALGTSSQPPPPFPPSWKIAENIERFHMTSQQPCWCSKTKKRRPCWCSKLILWDCIYFSHVSENALYSYWACYAWSPHLVLVHRPFTVLAIWTSYSLYVLFSHFRPSEVTLGNSSFQMSSYALAYLSITYEKRKWNSLGNITWSEMGKRNVRA